MYDIVCVVYFILNHSIKPHYFKQHLLSRPPPIKMFLSSKIGLTNNYRQLQKWALASIERSFYGIDSQK